MAYSNTAGLSDQLGCSGTSILCVAYIAALFGVVKFIMNPRFAKSTT